MADGLKLDLRDLFSLIFHAPTSTLESLIRSRNFIPYFVKLISIVSNEPKKKKKKSEGEKYCTFVRE